MLRVIDLQCSHVRNDSGYFNGMNMNRERIKEIQWRVYLM